MDIKPLISDPSLLGPLESLRGKTYSDIVDARACAPWWPRARME